ncbi:hypothetical protein C9374_008260 [Naegleria lovaniensis]|uniref:Uncharacterized protein n=1 Tax=Naegleria lovaniensis TaxID=51637 RepID=A0AA88GLC1_NAELO|nr:uncharacterized protein C9374_008260 [Naegleria lovaniensis]KAG2378621.1 hypothetical protein C9374_008260 [Naegleria lovaniensis]
MNNIFSVATTTNGANLPILYSPISSIVYGLRLNTQATSGQANLMISLDANSLYLSRDNQYEILFKHGSIPTDTDYDVKSPVLRNDAKYPYQKFVTRFIYGQNVILSYVMDNTYYTNADMRKSFPSSMYSSKVVSDGSNFSNGIVYFLIKATPISENMCISESNLDIPNSYIVGEYQYSSSLMITEGSYKKINSQVMALDLSKKDLPPNSEVVADFNQETATTIFSSNPSILYYNAKTKAVQSSSDNDNNSGTSSTQMAFHNLTYLPFGPPFKTVYYSFKYTIRMKIENDNNAKNSQFFILFPVSLNGFLSPANNYDAMVGVNSKYDPNKYFIDLISPTIIVGSIFGAFLALIAIGYLIAACAFVMTSQKREFNLGTLKPKIWLACLFPASIPVSICYVYFFLYEGRKNILAPPEIKRRRRVRFLITFSIISFVIGVLACAYFFGRLFFIHAQSVASANSREYVLGKKTPKSESFSPPIYTPKLMPCCSATRPSTDGKDAQSFTYFGTSQAFFSQKYGGRLDCAPPQWFMDSELGTKFVLQSIDGLPYVPPEHDPAIAAANSKNGRSSTFEMATTYCMANSVILMPVDDDFNAYGIPGVLFGIGPILYAFFLMSIVVFESFMKKSSSNGTTIQNYVIGQPPTNGYGENETNEDKTTLLIDDEARNSIYAVHPSAPLTYDNTMTAEPYYGNVQNNSEAEEYREPPAQQSTSQFMTKE